MANIRKYKLIAGINVDLDDGSITKGYYLEKSVLEGERSSSFFIPGGIDCAVDHIRKTHGIIDKARLAKISKFLEEVVADEVEEPAPEIVVETVIPEVDVVVEESAPEIVVETVIPEVDVVVEEIAEISASEEEVPE